MGDVKTDNRNLQSGTQGAWSFAWPDLASRWALLFDNSLKLSQSSAQQRSTGISPNVLNIHKETHLLIRCIAPFEFFFVREKLRWPIIFV